MSFQAMAWAVQQKCDSPGSKLVLLLLANYADEKGECYPSQKHLGEMCGCSRVTVNKHIQKLEKDNFITIKKGASVFSYNIYRLHLSVKKVNATSKLSLHNTQEIHISSFDDFWKVCPNKKAKLKAKQIYQKLIKDKIVTEERLIESMKNYSVSVKNENPKYICHPTTWLNQGRWEDEIDVPRETKNKNFMAG